MKSYFIVFSYLIPSHFTSPTISLLLITGFKEFFKPCPAIPIPFPFGTLDHTINLYHNLTVGSVLTVSSILKLISS